MSAPAAVVLLGNPGREYARTRHNVGFQLGEAWLPGAVWQAKFKGEWTKAPVGTRQVPVLRPLTFMNLVGESARALGDFFKVDPDAWVAVYDDVELAFGEVRFQTGGGLGGHNGLRSLKQHLGTDRFHRLRIGIGRPARGDVASFVLGRFTPDEEIELTRIVPRGIALLTQAFQGAS